MIKSFADRRTEELFRTGKASRVPADITRRALRKLETIHVAAQLSDLRVPPGNRLHSLKGDRAGQHAIAVNDNGGFASDSRTAMPMTLNSATTTELGVFP